ncbi:MAG: hypothetical protein AB7H90_03270 [Alphaproteobacteria bacterium]
MLIRGRVFAPETGSDGGTPPQNTGGSTQATWYQGLDDEHVGHVQSKGWDKLEPAAAAVEIAKAHREAQKFIGHPQEHLLRLPKDATDTDGWTGVWQRLGAPADAKDYTFEGVEAGEATASLVDTLRGAAASAKLPKHMAAEVGKSVAKWVKDQVTAHESEVAANREAAETAIRQSWGQNYDAHNYVAKQGQAALASRLGETLAPQLDGAMKLLTDFGFGALGREMMRVIGAGLGEDKFVGGGNGSGREVLTREMAVSRKTELLGDKAWTDRYLAGDTAAVREMKALNAIIAGEG